MNLFYIALLIFVLNLRTYVLMIWDKRKSKQQGAWRISEKQLLVSGLLFGSLGIIGGMLAPVHHKKRKMKFRAGMPAALLLQTYLVYQLYKWSVIRVNFYFEFPF